LVIEITLSLQIYVSKSIEILPLYKALVISPNEKTTEVGTLLAVARDAARKRENTQINPPIRALHFIAELGVYVAIYEAAEKSKPEQKSAG
jgi:hypothetical protein